MNNTAIKIIGKYAIILTILYGLEILIGFILSNQITDSKEYGWNSYLLTIQVIIPYLLNLTAALVINKDKKRLAIEGKYSVLLTIFYRPIGIVLFLIYVIDKEIEKKPAQNTGA